MSSDGETLQCTARYPVRHFDGTTSGYRETVVACLKPLDHDGDHMTRNPDGQPFAFPPGPPTRHVPRPLVEPQLIICHTCEARSGDRHRVVARGEQVRDAFLAAHDGH